MLIITLTLKTFLLPAFVRITNSGVAGERGRDDVTITTIDCFAASKNNLLSQR